MSPNPYNEDHLVEQPALALLAELGWQTACGLEETFAPEGDSLGRRDRRDHGASSGRAWVEPCSAAHAPPPPARAQPAPTLCAALLFPPP